MHGPVQKCFSAGAGALVHCRISGSDDAQEARRADKTEADVRRWAELLRSSRHRAEQALVLGAVVLHRGKPSRVFFFLYSLTQLAQQLLVFALSQISTEFGFQSRPV